MLTSPAPANFFKLAHSGMYNLGHTLECGQTFCWLPWEKGYLGVLGKHAVYVKSGSGYLAVETNPGLDKANITNYFQTHINFEAVIQSFPPQDRYLQAAIARYAGLRLVRQDPWECLASFLMSPLKQILQIRQVLMKLRSTYGAPISSFKKIGPVLYAFPDIPTIARCSELDLRAMQMGFRAKNLLKTSRQLESGLVDLCRLETLPYEEAKEQLTKLHGVGVKVADCVLLFAYGKQEAFPVDVWIARALRKLYFGRRKFDLDRATQFSKTHFGPNGGYAQQYLFHYVRNNPEILE